MWMVRLHYFLHFVFVIAVLAPAEQTNASPLSSASDMIAGVNALRASKGLTPYEEDPWLMAYAQEHAEYIASLGYGTHRHSDGTSPWDIGLVENVASGTEWLLTVDLVIITIWSDWVHWKTMVGYVSGQVGVGMASKDGVLYYVLDVRPGEEADDDDLEPIETATLSTQTTSDDGSATEIAITPAPFTFVPIITNTPRADGSIVHIVKLGETLWSIALSYRVGVEELRWLNGLPSDSDEIYLEQRLLIHPANAETPKPIGGANYTITPTATQEAFTVTPSHTTTDLLSTITCPTKPGASPTPTTPTPEKFDIKSIGIGVLIGIVILMVVVLNEFRRMQNR